MRNVALSEPDYDEAVRAAATRGQSVEEFVADAVRLYLHDEDEGPLVLTPEQEEVVRRGLADVRAGRVVRLEQLDARFEERREAWLEANADEHSTTP